jgi:2-hydroxy-6-oxonona-2,4-dienedioate hydrolase
LLLDGPREDPSLLSIAVRDYLRVGAGRMLGTLREARRRNAAESLGRITQPTLVVCGDRDPLVSRERAERLTHLLPSGSLTMIAGAPHGVVYSSVEPFVAAVRDFLATRPRSAC